MINFQALIDELLPSIYTHQQKQLFALYLELLHKWNRVYNLTAITKPRDVITKHLLDSLSVAPYLCGKRIIDIGTGAGFPGIPLAIVEPDKHFTLLDSNGKKCRFLAQVSIELDLHNVSVINNRVEQYSSSHCFDCVITRAFSTVNVMLSLSKHLCCRKGYFLAMKGIDPLVELKNLPDDIEVDQIISLKVPYLLDARNLVSLKFKEYPG